MHTAKEIIHVLTLQQNDSQRELLMRFFKTGPGEYGEGDRFLGLKVPQTRAIVKQADPDFQLQEIHKLLLSPWHEVRLCGLLIMVAQFERLSTKRLVNDEVAMAKRDAIVKTYLQYAHQANNWDLVDLSAPKILGSWLLLPTHLTQEEIDGKSCSSDKLTTLAGKQAIVDHLAYSNNLWRQRMSIVCSWKTSAKGDPSWCLRYAEIHLHHPHDLMHKAVGWMLREMGKRVSIDLLRSFLELHAHTMPRTTLRYAIEKMDESERQKWMKK